LILDRRLFFFSGCGFMWSPVHPAADDENYRAKSDTLIEPGANTPQDRG